MKKKTRILTISVILITVLGVFITACKKDNPDPLVATSIELVSGGSQTAQIETALVNPIMVLVKDQNGNAFKGTTVRFAVSEGSVSNAAVTTDASGNASVIWTLGATEGAQTLTVTALKADGTTALTGSPLTVNTTAIAVPLVATSIELVSGNSQTALIETTLANPVIVIVKDQNGTAFAGTEVSFTVTEGSVSNATLTTDASGNASVTWTLGATLGTQTLNASVTGLTGSPVEFSATGVALMDYDGNTYKIVEIGTQMWMAENLKVTHYPNGDVIPNVADNTAWANLGGNDTDKAYCYYSNSVDSLAKYGALYTYAAARSACPAGWHLPTDTEWTELENYITNDGHSGTEGTALKSTTGWNSNGNGTDDYGFFALPSGSRYTDGAFNTVGDYSYWWSATESSSTNAYYRYLYSNYLVVSSYNSFKSYGFSVRCVRD